MQASAFQQAPLTGKFLKGSVERAFQLKGWQDAYNLQQIILWMLLGAHALSYVAGWSKSLLLISRAILAGSFIVFNYYVSHNIQWRSNHELLTGLPEKPLNWAESIASSGIPMMLWCAIFVIEGAIPVTMETYGCLVDPSFEPAICGAYANSIIPAVTPLRIVIASFFAAVMDGRTMWSIPALSAQYMSAAMQIMWLLRTPTEATQLKVVGGTALLLLVGWGGTVGFALHALHSKRMTFRLHGLLYSRNKQLITAINTQKRFVQERNAANHAAATAETIRAAQQLAVSFLSHKMRNPMHMLVNLVDTLQDGGPTDMTTVCELKAATTSLQTFVEELIVQHELISAPESAHIEDLEVRAWLSGVIGELRRKHEARFELIVDTDVPSTCAINPRWLRQALLTMVSAILSSHTPSISMPAVVLRATLMLAPSISGNDRQAILGEHAKVVTSSRWIAEYENFTRDAKSKARQHETSPAESNSPQDASLSPSNTLASPQLSTSPQQTAATSSNRTNWWLHIELRGVGLKVCKQALRCLLQTESTGGFLPTPVERPTDAAATACMELVFLKLAAAMQDARVGVIQDSAAVSNSVRIFIQIPCQSVPGGGVTKEVTSAVSPQSTLSISPHNAVTVTDRRSWHRPRSRGTSRTSSSSSLRLRFASSSSSSDSSPRSLPGAPSPLHRQAMVARVRRGKHHFRSQTVPADTSPPSLDDPIIPAASLVSNHAPSPASEEPQPRGNDGTPQSPMPARTSHPQPSHRASEHGPARILIADDERVIRRIHERFVTGLGCEAEAVEDGVDVLPAVAAASSAGLPFHAILLDLVMRKQHGDETCRRLRREANYMGPIIAATANANESDIPNMMASGFTAVLRKPFTAAKLKETLLQVGVPLP